MPIIIITMFRFDAALASLMRADAERDKENSLLLDDLKATRHIMRNRTDDLEHELMLSTQRMNVAVAERDDVMKRHQFNYSVSPFHTILYS